MRKNLLFSSLLALLSLSILLPSASACDYYLYQDTQCNPPDSNYCISYSCQIYSGNTTLYCTDTDANNIWASGSASYRYREYSGYFIEGSFSDYCTLNWNNVSSCTGTGCKANEITCTSSNNYSMNSYECTYGCSNGRCLDPYAPDSTVSTYGSFTALAFPGKISGTASDNESGLKDVKIKIQRDADYKHWTGSSWAPAETWLTTSGLSNWEYSISSSNLSIGTYSVKSTATDNAGNAETSMGYNPFSIAAEASIIGSVCNYYSYGDSQCAPDSNIYCIYSICAQQPKKLVQECSDSDDMNSFREGTVSYSYRDFGGDVMSGTADDECTLNNNLIASCSGTGCSVEEKFCKTPLPSAGMVYDFNKFICSNSCRNGACLYPSGTEAPAAETCSDSIMNCHNDCMSTGTTDECCETGIDCGGPCTACSASGLPEAVSDAGLLTYISSWANNELAENEAENDRIMEEIIGIWKNS